MLGPRQGLCRPSLGEHLEPVLFHDGEQFQGHAAGFLGAGLPLFNGGLAGVEVTGKDRLTDTKALTQILDLFRLNRSDDEAGSVESPHSLLVHGPCTVHSRNC